MDNRLKKGLGRGLSSLLGDSSSKKIQTNKVSINDDKPLPNPFFKRF